MLGDFGLERRCGSRRQGSSRRTRVLPPLQCLSASWPRSAAPCARRRPVRDLGLRQIRSHRQRGGDAGCRRCSPTACRRRAHGPDADAQRARASSSATSPLPRSIRALLHLRIGRGGDLSPALVRAAPAGRRLSLDPAARHGAHRAVGRRPERPRNRARKLTDADLSTDSLPLPVVPRNRSRLVPAKVGRVTFTGDLGYEIWVKPDYLRTLYETC